MTRPDQMDGLDGVLGDWLAEGPTRTPDHTLAAAVQHARSHPRRRGILAGFQRDPMGGGVTRSFAAVPGPLFAALTLLLVSAIGVSVVGGFWDAVTPPTPPSAPTLAPTIGPSTGPAPTPSERPSPSFPISVGLVTGAAATMIVEVTDASGLLVDARTAPPTGQGSVAQGVVEVVNVDDRTLLLTWTDVGCDITYELRIETTSSMTLSAPSCLGDAMAYDRRLFLQFAVAVDATAVRVDVVGPATPAIGTVQVPGGSSPMEITLRGDAAVVSGIRAATSDELAAAPAMIDADLVAWSLSATELAIMWAGSPCDVSATLVVEPDRIVLREDPRPACDAVGIAKGLVITFVDPVDEGERALVLIPAILLP